MAHRSTPHLGGKIRYLATLLLLLLTACGTPIGTFVSTAPSVARTQSTPAFIAWPAFNDGGQRNAVNTAETTITPGNVGRLVRLWQHTLHATVDGTLVEQPNVTTGGESKTCSSSQQKRGASWHSIQPMFPLSGVKIHRGQILPRVHQPSMLKVNLCIATDWMAKWSDPLAPDHCRSQQPKP